MAEYQLTATDTVIRTADNVSIPHDPDNRDWVEYQQWLADGGVPEPYVPPASVTFDPEYDNGNTMYVILTQ
jgi:hypothetical protein